MRSPAFTLFLLLIPLHLLAQDWTQAQHEGSGYAHGGDGGGDGGHVDDGTQLT